MRNTDNFELGAVQKRANLVDLEKAKKCAFSRNIGLDTAESGPSKLWVTGIPAYRHHQYRCVPVAK